MSRFIRPVIKNEVGFCCSVKMVVVSNRLTCLRCSALLPYIAAEFDEVKSQQTQYGTDGKIMYGKSCEKSDEDKIVSIYKEYTEKIAHKLKYQLPQNLMRRTSTLMYKIVRDGNGKKKDNRDQLFAACLYLIVIQDLSVYSVQELVNMFGLGRYGIGNGKGHIINYIVGQIEIGTPSDEILQISDVFCNTAGTLSINVDVSYNLVSRYLTFLKLGDEKLNTKPNMKFCIGLIEFMNGNSVAYNTTAETKCAGVVYYLIVRLGLVENIKKSSIAGMMGIYQSIMMGVFNVLSAPYCQEIMPREYRFVA
jgi:hypothetical protein